MIKVSLDNATHIATVEMSGVLDHEEVRLYMLGCRRSLGPYWISLMVDKGVIEVTITHKQIDYLSELSAQLNREQPILATIIVTDSNMMFGMSRVFQSYREVEGPDLHVGVFRTMEQANEFIEEVRHGR